MQDSDTSVNIELCILVKRLQRTDSSEFAQWQAMQQLHALLRQLPSVSCSTQHWLNLFEQRYAQKLIERNLYNHGLVLLFWAETIAAESIRSQLLEIVSTLDEVALWEAAGHCGPVKARYRHHWAACVEIITITLATSMPTQTRLQIIQAWYTHTFELQTEIEQLHHYQIARAHCSANYRLAEQTICEHYAQKLDQLFQDLPIPTSMHAYLYQNWPEHMTRLQLYGEAIEDARLIAARSWLLVLALQRFMLSLASDQQQLEHLRTSILTVTKQLRINFGTQALHRFRYAIREFEANTHQIIAHSGSKKSKSLPITQSKPADTVLWNYGRRVVIFNAEQLLVCQVLAHTPSQLLLSDNHGEAMVQLDRQRYQQMLEQGQIFALDQIAKHFPLKQAMQSQQFGEQ